MNKLSGVASGPAIGMVSVAAALAVGIALYVAGVLGPSAPPEIEKTADSAPLVSGEKATEAVENESEKSVSAQSQSVPDAVQPEENQTAAKAMASPQPPSIDTFRLDPDGSMLVAGKAHPEWETSVTLDGAVLDQVTPDGSGQFVAFLTVENSNQPRILSLITRDPNGDTQLASLDEIILAPTPKMAGQNVDIALNSADEPEVSEGDESATSTSGETTEARSAAGVQGAGAVTDLPKNSDTEQDVAVASSDGVETQASNSGQDDGTAQTVLLSDETGVRVLQTAPSSEAGPDVMSAVALDAITYSEAGEVELSGRGQGEGFVRVYLDNAPVTTSRIAEDGNWRTELPAVDTGVYTLRIDETDAEGNVTSRVETPFKREDEALLAEAEAQAEQPRVRAVTVQPGSTLWAISRETYGEGLMYVRVFEANRDRIRNPDLIYPGQVFTLPE